MSNKSFGSFLKNFFKIFGFFDLEETKKDYSRLIDHILWAKVEDGIIFNQDLSMQVTFSYRQPDLETDFSSKIDMELKKRSSDWVLYAETQRVKTGEYFENFYYLTLQYLLPIDTEKQVKEQFIKGEEEKARAILQDCLNFFREETDKFFESLKNILQKENVHRLSSDETVSYLYSTVSPKRIALKAPEDGMYIDCYLCDSAFLGESGPVLENHYVRVISFLAYPGKSMQEVLSCLNALGFEYRWANRFIFLDKEESKAEIQSYRKLWFKKRESVGRYVNRKMSSDEISCGYYTCCVVVIDEDEKEVEKKTRRVEQVITNLEISAEIGGDNAVNAWIGSLPGMSYHNKRKPLLVTTNLAYMIPT